MKKTAVARPPGRPPKGPRRRPLLRWQTLAPAEPATPAELTADLVAVLVGLEEWTRHAGLDFDAALAAARQAEIEREPPGGRGAR